MKDTHADGPTGTNGPFGLITAAYDELRDPVARAANGRKLVQWTFRDRRSCLIDAGMANVELAPKGTRHPHPRSEP